jgi:hypothetical protein
MTFSVIKSTLKFSYGFNSFKSFTIWFKFNFTLSTNLKNKARHHQNITNDSEQNDVFVDGTFVYIFY